MLWESYSRVFFLRKEALEMKDARSSVPLPLMYLTGAGLLGLSLSLHCHEITVPLSSSCNFTFFFSPIILSFTPRPFVWNGLLQRAKDVFVKYTDTYYVLPFLGLLGTQ